MSNMSYCRFQNTLGDLQECFEAFEEGNEDLSREEQQAKLSLLEVCKNIVELDDANDVSEELEKLLYS